MMQCVVVIGQNISAFYEFKFAKVYKTVLLVLWLKNLLNSGNSTSSKIITLVKFLLYYKLENFLNELVALMH